MKLSELKEAVDRAMERATRYREDPEVVVRTDNPSVGGCSKTGITHAHTGGDWDKDYFILSPEVGVVRYSNYQQKSDLRHIALERLQQIRDGHEKCGQKYIAKVREQEWIDGFLEGFRRFGLEVNSHKKDKE